MVETHCPVGLGEPTGLRVCCVVLVRRHVSLRNVQSEQSFWMTCQDVQIPLLHSSSPHPWLIPCSGTEAPLACNSKLESVALTIGSPRECFLPSNRKVTSKLAKQKIGNHCRLIFLLFRIQLSTACRYLLP